jgi:hypothetical protein
MKEGIFCCPALLSVLNLDFTSNHNSELQQKYQQEYAEIKLPEILNTNKLFISRI